MVADHAGQRNAAERRAMHAVRPADIDATDVTCAADETDAERAVDAAHVVHVADAVAVEMDVMVVRALLVAVGRAVIVDEAEWVLVHAVTMDADAVMVAEHVVAALEDVGRKAVDAGCRFEGVEPRLVAVVHVVDALGISIDWHWSLDLRLEMV